MSSLPPTPAGSPETQVLPLTAEERRALVEYATTQPEVRELLVPLDIRRYEATVAALEATIPKYEARCRRLEAELAGALSGRAHTEQQYVDAIRARTDLAIKLEAELAVAADCRTLAWLAENKPR